MVVFKYQLKDDRVNEIELPKNARILKIDVQNGIICLWALVDPKYPLTRRVIEIFGTGHDMPEANRAYIGTFSMEEMKYIFHAFERL